MKYKLIDTAGQITGLVVNRVANYAAKSSRAEYAKRILLNDKRIEQVGFLCKSKKSTGVTRFVMMGNELCINGTIAAGYWLSKKAGLSEVKMETSGLNKIVRIYRTGNLVSATFPDLVHQNNQQ